MTGSRQRLGQVVARLALALGVLVALLIPTGYLAVTYSQLKSDLALLAELKSTKLSKYIYVHRDLWTYHIVRLAELIEVPEAGEDAVGQRVFDSGGGLVLKAGVEPLAPLIRVTVPVVVAAAQIGTVEVASSLRPVLFGATAVAVPSVLLGFLIVFVIRVLPLRIIDQTIGDLAAAEERYRLLFECNPFPMVVVDRETKGFIAVNEAATEHYGWSRAETLRMTVADLRPPGDPPAERPSSTVMDASGAARYASQRHRTKSGVVIEVDIVSRPVVFDGRKADISLAIDVTRRNSAERLRLATEEQLRQSQKMEAVGQLTGGIAHDFNNILTVIIGNMEALNEEYDLGAEVRARVATVDSAVDRAAELTSRLLAFSRKQPLRPQVTDVNDLIADTVKLVGRTLGSHVECRTTLGGALWPVDIDRPQLESALVNLCINARDAMPDGGKLQIETNNVSIDEWYASHHAEVTEGDYAMIAVTDTGIGMPPDVAAKVFDPFFTTKEAGKGTGLGLSMVYGFVKQSRGHIKVYSEVGRGTTFKIYLPRTHQTPQKAGVREAPATPSGTERILVVEDESGVRTNAVGQLRSLGYDVDEAADGVEGLAALEAAKSPYALLLTDVVMPRMGGKALAAAVQSRWPQMKIVFMSGYAERAVVHHGNVDAGVLLLSKPFRKADLAQLVRQALDMV